MHVLLRRTRPAWAVLVLVAAAGAQAQQARGVNPADIDSRLDVIVKHIKLDPEGTINSLLFKYDYKLNPNWALNFELPVYSTLTVPGFTTSGNGDLFARVRWVVPDGAWTYGASFETVLPVASRDQFSAGRHQINGAVLAVRAFSRSFITAVAVKQTTSIGGDSDFPKLSNTEIRVVPVWILDDGWAVTGEVRKVWEHRSNLTWQRVEGVLNKQFTEQWAGALGYSRDWGERKDMGVFSATVKYFF